MIPIKSLDNTEDIILKNVGVLGELIVELYVIIFMSSVKKKTDVLTKVKKTWLRSGYSVLFKRFGSKGIVQCASFESG